MEEGISGDHASASLPNETSRPQIGPPPATLRHGEYGPTKTGGNRTPQQPKIERSQNVNRLPASGPNMHYPPPYQHPRNQRRFPNAGGNRGN